MKAVALVRGAIVKNGDALQRSPEHLNEASPLVAAAGNDAWPNFHNKWDRAENLSRVDQGDL